MKPIFKCLGNEIAENDGQASEKFRTVSGIWFVAGGIRTADGGDCDGIRPSDCFYEATRGMVTGIVCARACVAPSSDSIAEFCGS